MTQKTLRTACPHCSARNTLEASVIGNAPACSQCRRPLLPRQLFTLTDEQFPSLLKGEQIPWVVDFWAPSCAPCKRLAPLFEQMAKSNIHAARFAKLNVDNYPAVAKRQKVQSIPALVVYSGTKEMSRLTGSQPKQKIQHWLNQTIGGKTS